MNEANLSRSGPKVKDVLERFWSKVDIRGPDDCWLWLDPSYARGGYGRFTMTIGPGKSVNMSAHRLAWELTNALEIPADMDGCHKCDTPKCVNPAHIFPGSRHVNMVDAAKKGRLRQAKLTEEQVRRFLSEGANIPEMAKEFGCNRDTLRLIRSGKSWKHISNPDEGQP